VRQNLRFATLLLILPMRADFLRIVQRAVAAVGLVSALIGLCVSVLSLVTAIRGKFAGPIAEFRLPHFYAVFYSMWGICASCCVGTLWCSFKLLRGRLRHSWIFVSLLAFELAFFFASRALVAASGLGRSIGAAFGVTNGALMPQLVVLFPVWGALLLLWAVAKRPAREGST
jgi:hypothetical protein